MTSPYQNQRIHPNSIAAYHSLDLEPRIRAVADIYLKCQWSRNGDYQGLTDREVYWHFTGRWEGDLNAVRPRITRMLENTEEKPNPLREADMRLVEVGNRKCKITGKMVRVCMIEQADKQGQLF